MKVRFSAAAFDEMAQAADSYEAQEIDLGTEFLNEIELAVERIAQFPLAWSPLTKRARRCQINRFPYSLIYSVNQDLITVIAVMHHRRDPQSWYKGV